MKHVVRMVLASIMAVGLLLALPALQVAAATPPTTQQLVAANPITSAVVGPLASGVASAQQAASSSTSAPDTSQPASTAPLPSTGPGLALILPLAVLVGATASTLYYKRAQHRAAE